MSSFFSSVKSRLSASKILVVSERRLAKIDEAVSYSNASSVGAAYEWLIDLRKKAEAGRTLRLLTPVSKDLHGVDAFDDWVRDRYPVFVDDPYHSQFHRSKRNA
jgi:hypothetical protein